MTNTQKYLLYYDALSKFKEKYYNNLFTQEHLVSGEVHISSLKYPDGGQDVEANFWGYILEMDNKKYLLPSKRKNSEGVYESIDIKEVLPFYAKGLQKVAHKGVVYHLIGNPISARFKSEKRLTMRELIDRLSCLDHSNPIHQKIIMFLAVSSVLDRVYFRLSTPPGALKDSSVDTLGNLIGNCATIVNPTLAKLEFRTTYKWLVINEIVDISKAEWRNIQQYLLDAGAFKPSIEKHSRAFGGTKENLDISNMSLSLFFNDIDCYPEPLEYFDFVTKSAVKDRFPALRLWGVAKEDFNSIKNVDVDSLVNDNMEFYKDIIYTLTYYKDSNNVLSDLHRFSMDKLVGVPERWKVSLGRVLKVIDLYCESQEEFDSWVKIIMDAIEDYREMVQYTKVFEKFVKKYPVGCDNYNRVMSKFRVLNTWKEKLDLLSSGNIVVEDKALW